MVNYVTENRVTEGTSLWDLLGVPEISDTQIIDKAWKRCEQTLDQRYAWKALRDPLYRSLYLRDPSIETLTRAGFFDDGLPCGVEELTACDPRFLCTTMSKVKMGVSAPSRDQYILVTTGAFSPVHNGHLTMMEKAKRIIEREGNLVAGMYFCPGHDSYVGTKHNGTAGIPAAERIHMLELALDQDINNGMMVDPWAARYLPCEVNFTDVLRRMRRYMNQHFRKDLKYAYVYGSDNEGFSLVLEGSDFRAMPIPRTEESSTAVRQGASNLLPAVVKDYLRNAWPTGVYQIRDDQCGDHTLRNQVISLLSSTMAPNPIEVMDVNDQRRRGREIVGDKPTISMDPFFQGTHRIDVCRAFQAADFQAKGYMTHRPGTDDLYEQVGIIPKGDYILVEDDVATGRSIAHVKSYLAGAGINITEDLILANLDTQPDDILDVVDARDFMLDAPQGGLVVWRLDYRCRAPYLLPFVNLSTRAMVRPGKDMALSIKLWRVNRQSILAATNPYKRIHDCQEAFRLFATKHGWSSDTTLVDYCDFHIRVLEEAEGMPCTPA